MTKPPDVERTMTDDELVTAILTAEHNINMDGLGGETKTYEEALLEMDYFYAPANAANIGRVEAVRYAWKKHFVFRYALILWGFPCASIHILSLVIMPWQHGVPRAMEMAGVFGFVPMLFGAVWLRRAWRTPRNPPAYKGRAAPLLLIGGAGLIILGLLGTWLA